MIENSMILTILICGGRSICENSEIQKFPTYIIMVAVIGTCVSTIIMFLYFIAKSECDGLDSPKHIAAVMNNSVYSEKESQSSSAPPIHDAPSSSGKMHTILLKIQHKNNYAQALSNF